MGSLPEPAVKLTGAQQRLWDSIWASPLAADLSAELDIAPITRMIIMQTDPQVFLNRDLLTELRHLEDRFYLSPKAREAAPPSLKNKNPEGSKLDELAERRQSRHDGAGGGDADDRASTSRRGQPRRRGRSD